MHVVACRCTIGAAVALWKSWSSSTVANTSREDRDGSQWQGMVKEIETLVSQFGAKGGLLTFDDFVKVFQEVL
jgi:hypothetical protein